MVVAVWNIAQAGLEVHLTVGAEVFAELAGVGVYGDQACINGVGQQATLALRTGRHAGGQDRRAVGLGRLGNRRAGVEIRHAPATLPHCRFGVDFVFPQFFAGVGIQRDQVVVWGADKHFVADLQGRQLVFGTVTVADGHVAGVIGPGDLELVDVVAVDLVQRGETAATFGITVVGPIFLRIGRSHRGDARACTGGRNAGVRDKHIARCHRHAQRQYGGDAIGTPRRFAGQQRIHQCDHHANHRKHEQSREQRPVFQAHVGHRPHGGSH